MIPLFKVFMSKDILEPLSKTLFSGFIGEGPKVVEFENIIKTKLECPNVLAVNNGTSALHLAYQMVINYEEDVEIIASPMTCSATLTPILANKGKIVWADVDPISGNISPEDIRKKITKKTKAIVAMHWGGIPCNLKEINQIAEENDLKVIEDGAHSLGATYEGQYLGNHSDFIMFSLQAIKHVTSIDGGILVVKDKNFYERAKLLRWYGISRDVKDIKDLRCELDLAEAGHKMHMNDVTATIGMENFKFLDHILEKYRENAEYYNEIFSENDISFAKALPNSSPAYWLYTIHAPDRDSLMYFLKKEGIACSKVHARNDTHSIFKKFKTNLPHVNQFNDTHLCIPVGWWVTEKDREKIAKKIINYLK